MSASGGRKFTLSGRRLELLQALRREQGLEPGRVERIRRRPPAASSPLSFAQQRLWFLDRLTPGSAAYNVPLAIRLTGRLDPAALQAAFSALAARQAVLRTTLVVVEGQPAQVVSPPAPLALPLVDGSALPAEAREAWARERAAELVRLPFDLARGPLLRLALLRLAPGEHVLVACLHHAISDGWSLEILRRELAAYYAAASATPAAPVLPELPIQYSDFACWQREWAAAGGLDDQLAWWQRQLAGAPTLLELPADRPRPAVPEMSGGVAALWLPAETASGLRELALGQGATPFMVLLGILAALLVRHGGQEDLLIGTLVAGRHRTETEGLIGFFANTLVLRADASGDPPFLELLARVREATLGAFAHQDLPFERLVEQLAPERRLRHMPLFQVLLVLQNVVPAAVEIPGLTLAPLPARTGMARLDLGLTATLSNDGLHVAAEYATELFDASSVRRLLLRYGRLAAAAVASPELRLSALPQLPASERHQLLAEWGQGAADLGGEPRLHRLFALRAARQPQRVALVCGEELVTYGQLARRASLLAGRLRALGVGPERTVGLLMERRPALIVAILAVLEAGGAYLPFAADSPPERLAFVLDDAGVQLVLADPALAPRLAGRGLRVLDPEGRVLVAAGAGGPRLPGSGAGEAGSDLPGASDPGADLAGGPGPANLCYVIYTSGSTGRPKGVMVPHAAAAATLRWRLARFALTPADCVLQNIAFTFDPSLWQIFGALLSGARLVLVPPGGHQDFAGLVRTIARERVTITDLAPSMLRAFLEQDGLDGCGSLRLLFAGGEALAPDLAARFAARFPGAALYNIYGPTEAAIDACTWHCAPRPAAATLPIGYPISGKRLAVLGRDLEPVPIGVAGELFIGGPALARGYLGRPDLTAERFLPDAAAGRTGDPGARGYRTGDLVRHLADGLLEFVGRVDRQVKLRGFRIELGEIEAALARHPRVREAVAMVSHGRTGEPLLAAWFAPDWPSAAAELRLLLGESLPGHMVPAALTGVAALPRTASGKVDRDALPEPAGQAGGSAGAAAGGPASRFVPPVTALERTLAAIWQELLGRDRVGSDDNFFDLGGHSLLLVRMQARVQQALGSEVPLVDLFNYPSIGALAAHLSAGVAAGGDASAAAAGREGGGEPSAPSASVIAATLRAGEQIAAFARSGAAPALEPIAVIGMAGRFPGARDLDQLWENLRQGKESIRFFSADELLAAGVRRELLAHPDYVRARGALDDFDRFDAVFFDIAPREAEALDPQHRLFLESAWEALESAGCDPGRMHGPVGVFAGVSANTYLLSQLLGSPEALAAADASQTMLGSDKDFLATRVSYKLNLHGPSLTVQTACSTSLVAVHLACRALLGRECDLALAGGVSIAVPQAAGYLYREGGIASPDGHCRAFDAQARGTVAGSGVGVVVLRRLADALAAGDPIRAVLRGSAINNDGAAKVGYTAPGVDGQAEVIAAAQQLAGIGPDDVTYIEAHGTGTPLGDPIEIAALAKVFGAATSRRGFCAIGSIKTNIGHLDAASGVAGLIKTVLALEHREIPPSLHFTAPNPRIDFAASPFFVNASLAAWPGAGAPRRAGVSSFGIGGTNAHVVLEEAPASAPSGPSRPLQLLPLSARTAAALEALSDRLAAHLAARPEVSFADLAHTLQLGRRAMSHRRVVVAADAAGAARSLARRDPSRVLTMVAGRRPVVFLFPGQGAQHPGMGRELYAAEPVFRGALDACLEVLAPRLPGCDLLGLLHPRPEETAAAAARLTETAFAQPLLFAVEVALARLWMSWGIEPAAMLGHSLGEYVAACLAGVFSLEDGLAVVAERARLMQELPRGAMLAVPLPEAAVRERLAARGDLALAAVNAPALCVVSGPEAAVAALAAELEQAGLAPRRLHTSHAFHSALMEPMIEPFGKVLARVRLSPPERPYLSNLTGTWIEAAQATDVGYWLRHLRQPVRFAAALQELAAEPDRVLLEVGPDRGLATLVRRQEGAKLAAVSSLGKAGEEGREEEGLLTALGRLWLAGVDVDWHGFAAHERRRRVPLPTYPFERQRYWLQPPGRRNLAPASAAARAAGAKEPASAVAAAESAAGGAEAMAAATPGVLEATAAASGSAPPAGRQPPEDWFWAPVWHQSLLPRLPAGAAAGTRLQRWLLFADDGGVMDGLASHLARAGHGVVVVEAAGARGAGDGFAALSAGSFRIDPGCPDHYVRLLSELAGSGQLPERVVHAFCLGGAAAWSHWSQETAGVRRQGAADRGDLGESEAAVARGFTSLLLLAQAMGEVSATVAAPPAELAVIADGLWAVTGEEPISPAKATLLGPVRVIPLEYGVRCRAVDVVLPADPPGRERLAADLLRELVHPWDGASRDPGLAASPSPACSAAAPAAVPPPALAAAEPLPSEPPPEPVVALRGGRRWVQRFDLLPPAHRAAPAPGAGGRLRRGGVVLVTGGLGGIGSALARHLFETASAKLVLLARTPLPPRSEWAALLLAAAAASDPQRRRVERLLALEQLGAEVLVVTADVADGAQLARAVEQAVARFGAVHAVIHAAGVPAGGIIQRKSESQAAAVLAPKVRGALLLERLLPAAGLDLCVYCSSLASILGGAGQADYCAANAFLDAMAAAAGGRGAAAVVSIAWDAWREVGMAAEAPAAGPRHGQRPAEQGLLTAEGLLAFDRALASGLPQVVVSTLDLARLVAAMRPGRGRPDRQAQRRAVGGSAAQVAGAGDATSATGGPDAASAAGDPDAGGAATDVSSAGLAAGAAAPAAHPRPELATSYAAPRNETEAALAAIWEEVLGVEPVGIHDDFAELGGHSLLALQVLARVRASLAADLPLRAIFDAPTVAALAVRLLEREATASDQGDLEQMLARLEGLSDGEAAALLDAAPVAAGSDLGGLPHVHPGRAAREPGGDGPGGAR
jgi:amino acid adenylation domain-containing protein